MARSIIVYTPRFTTAVLVGMIFFVSVPLAMRTVTQSHIVLPLAAPKVDAILIPGASVMRGALSPVLSARADTALELFRAGRSEHILISGDEEPNYDEVTPVRNYLLSAGVTPKAIILDGLGFDTYSSMYRAGTVFGAKSLIIVSQDFHLPRSVFVARSLGINATGVIADGGTLSAYLREIPASWKALLDILLHRRPK